jgi:hypothetical protein
VENKNMEQINYFLMTAVLVIVLFLSANLSASENAITLAQPSCLQADSTAEQKKTRNAFYTLRVGVGGFLDNRSKSGRLVGGQFIFDAKPFKYPFAISVSFIEFYSSSWDPEHSYQIQNMGTFNLFYIIKPAKLKNIKIFCGGGIGVLQTPKDEPKHEDDYATSLFYDAEAGVNYKVFKKIGVYGTVKYIYAQKKKDNITLIDFNELIYVIGISFNFGF